MAPLLRRVLVEELVLDSVLAATSGAESFNLALWDVTDPLQPVRVCELAATTPPRNRRGSYPCAVFLEPGHRYRAVAHVTEKRATAPPNLPARRDLPLSGGLDFIDLDPTAGAKVAEATLRSEVALSLRYVTERGPSER